MHEYFVDAKKHDLAVTRSQAMERLKKNNTYGREPEPSVIHHHVKEAPCSPAVAHEFFHPDDLKHQPPRGTYAIWLEQTYWIQRGYKLSDTMSSKPEEESNAEADQDH